MNMDTVNEFIRLDKKKKDLNAEVKLTQKKLDKLSDEIMEEMDEDGLDNIKKVTGELSTSMKEFLARRSMVISKHQSCGSMRMGMGTLSKSPTILYVSTHCCQNLTRQKEGFQKSSVRHSQSTEYIH